MLKQLKWLLHPISLLILAQICWGLLMFVWIKWYLLKSQEMNDLLQKIPAPTAKSYGQWVVLAQGCLLMGFLLIALYMIFVSQRKLSKTTKMQDTILSSVTHELKTPLASIRLYTETLLMRSLGATEQKKFLQRSLTETERLQKLIDTVLVSARLESGQTPLAHTRVNLKNILSDCFLQAKDRFGDTRRFELFVEQSNTPHPFVGWGNPHHLTMLFDNLLDNAVKHTPLHGHIQARLTLKKNTLLVVAITDTGLGIEKHNLKKIFKKFYTIERHLKTKVQGSGLGLSVCASIVKEHHGKIYAHSDGLNKGSTFYVEFQRFSAHS
jgi:signal transduction histidine kinase